MNEGGETLAEAAPQARLSDLSPQEVFVRCYRREHDDAPPPRLVAAFEELLASTAPASEERLPVADPRPLAPAQEEAVA